MKSKKPKQEKIADNWCKIDPPPFDPLDTAGYQELMLDEETRRYWSGYQYSPGSYFSTLSNLKNRDFNYPFEVFRTVIPNQVLCVFHRSNRNALLWVNIRDDEVRSMDLIEGLHAFQLWKKYYPLLPGQNSSKSP